jgi:hypothetical protein
VADSVFEHVVFIVGAGHSHSAKAPLTSELTDWIVDGGGSVDRSGWSDGEKDALRSVRDHLKAKGAPSLTYESIFTWLWTRYFSNDPTMYRVAWDSEDQLSAIGIERKTAYDALRRIEDGVRTALTDDQLSVLDTPNLTLDAVKDGDVQSLTLITLNHDRLLERCLLQRAGPDPPYDDGFEGPLDGLGLWDIGSGSTARNWECPVQLIKIHGSIDWWSPTGWNDGGLVYRSSERPKDKGCDKRPLFLVGTGPKLFQSSNLVFARQILAAGYALARATCVVTVGYGFGDVRMNSLWEGASNLKNRDKSNFGYRFPTLAIDPSKDCVLDRLKRLRRAGDLGKMFEDAVIPAEFLECEAKDARWSRCKDKLADLQRLCATKRKAAPAH